MIVSVGVSTIFSSPIRPFSRSTLYTFTFTISPTFATVFTSAMRSRTPNFEIWIIHSFPFAISTIAPTVSRIFTIFPSYLSPTSISLRIHLINSSAAFPASCVFAVIVQFPSSSRLTSTPKSFSIP